MNLLDVYLQANGLTRYQVTKLTRMPESTLRSMTKKPFKRWTVEQMSLIGRAVGKDAVIVMGEVEKLSEEIEP